MKSFDTMKHLNHESGLDYENTFEGILKVCGFHHVRKTPITHDWGADLLATNSLHKRFNIQCKHSIYKRNVGYSGLQEAFSSGYHYMTQNSILITNGGFTSEVKREMITKDKIHTKCFDGSINKLFLRLSKCFEIMDNKNLALYMLNNCSLKEIKNYKHTVNLIFKTAKYYHLTYRDLVVSKIVDAFYNKELLIIKNYYKNNNTRLNSLRYNHNIYYKNLRTQNHLFNSIDKLLHD